MAALIHHYCFHPAGVSAALTLSPNPTVPHLKPLAQAQVTSYLSPSKTSLSLPSSKTQLFPSFSISKSPSFQQILTPDHLPIPQLLTNHELSRLLKLSIDYTDVQLSKAVHASIIKVQQGVMFNSLISSYIELGNLNYAMRVFNSLLTPDVVSFTAMISCLAKSNRENEAVQLFFEMRGLGIEPNAYAFVAMLTACMRMHDFELGSQVHVFLIKTGHLNCSYVANALMALYSGCGYSDCVEKLFANMSQRDNASWNTMISCLVKDCMYTRAFELFRSMIMKGFRADNFTLSSVLVACARSFAKTEGMVAHGYAHKIGYETNLSTRNALIEYYSMCGHVEDVRLLFDSMPVRDVFTGTQMVKAYMGFGLVDLALEVLFKMPEKNCVTYNVVLAGFCKNGEGLRALRFFLGMVGSGVEIDDFSLTSVLDACGLVKNLRLSQQVQAFVHKIGFGTNWYIQAALLNMCTKCGRMSDAEKMFDRLLLEQRRSSIMLTTMICGYARISNPEKALFLIREWLYEGGRAMDEVELASILGVCGDLGFLKLGEQFHAVAFKCVFLADVGVGNSIVSLYSKCGDMEKALQTFSKMSNPDIVSWNSVLTGFILNRQGERALDIWEKMQKLKIQPDKVTCLLIITAYRHSSSSLVEQCRDFFLSMNPVYGIEPNSDHYACLVGVLGHWGFLEEAEEVIEKMPFEPEASVWRALLDSCRIHKNSTIGKRAAKNILAMEPQDPSTYVLKSNLYSASGRWHCSELIRDKMKENGFRKFPARSWVVHENRVHSFFGRDISHDQSKDIYSALDILFMECTKAGYVPDTSYVLHDVDEVQKINFLLYHSGKLAAAYGILKARPGEPVKVFKNVLLCGDCHTFLRYVSVVTKREIHLRDASGFHRFANGECCCRDCW